MSTRVEEWVNDVEEQIPSNDNLIAPVRAGALGLACGLDTAGYLAEETSYHWREDDSTYSIGGEAMDMFFEEEASTADTYAFVAGEYAGMLAPGAAFAATGQPAFLLGYLAGPTVDTLRYSRDTYLEG